MYRSSLSILAATVSSITKIIFVYLNKSLVWFGFATATQVIFLSIFLIVVYSVQNNSIINWKISFNYSLDLIRKSWPLAVSAFFALIYLKIDQVMLGQLSSSENVGLYAAAARLSEIWYVLPTALATAIFPSIVKIRKKNKFEYLLLSESLYRTIFYSSFIIVLPIFFLSNIIVYYLYGVDFEGAGEILSIHIWACPAMFIGAIYAKVLISEDLLIYGLIRDITGAVLNIILNFYLINSYGGKGAAIATIISYTFSSYFLFFLFSRTRNSAIVMTKAIIIPQNIFKSIAMLKILLQNK